MAQFPSVQGTPPQVATQLVSEEAFVADRQKFWSSFTGFATFAVAAVVVLLILLAIFLT